MLINAVRNVNCFRKATFVYVSEKIVFVMVIVEHNSQLENLALLQTFVSSRAYFSSD